MHVRKLKNTYVHTCTHVFIYCSKAFLCLTINLSFPGLSYWNTFLILSTSAPERGGLGDVCEGKIEGGKRKRKRESGKEERKVEEEAKREKRVKR